jgi:curved DNA-binding protein CbpA
MRDLIRQMAGSVKQIFEDGSTTESKGDDDPSAGAPSRPRKHRHRHHSTSKHRGASRSARSRPHKPPRHRRPRRSRSPETKTESQAVDPYAALNLNKGATHYEILGIESTATAKEIKKAYRMRSLEHHPDKGGDSETFKIINEANRILSDPKQRREYDSNLKSESRSHQYTGAGAQGGSRTQRRAKTPSKPRPLFEDTSRMSREDKENYFYDTMKKWATDNHRPLIDGAVHFGITREILLDLAGKHAKKRLIKDYTHNLINRGRASIPDSMEEQFKRLKSNERRYTYLMIGKRLSAIHYTESLRRYQAIEEQTGKPQPKMVQLVSEHGKVTKQLNGEIQTLEGQINEERTHYNREKQFYSLNVTRTTTNEDGSTITTRPKLPLREAITRIIYDTIGIDASDNEDFNTIIDAFKCPALMRYHALNSETEKGIRDIETNQDLKNNYARLSENIVELKELKLKIEAKIPSRLIDLYAAHRTSELWGKINTLFKPSYDKHEQKINRFLGGSPDTMIPLASLTDLIGRFSNTVRNHKSWKKEENDLPRIVLALHEGAHKILNQHLNYEHKLIKIKFNTLTPLDAGTSITVTEEELDKKLELHQQCIALDERYETLNKQLDSTIKRSEYLQQQEATEERKYRPNTTALKRNINRSAKIHFDTLVKQEKRDLKVKLSETGWLNPKGMRQALITFKTNMERYSKKLTELRDFKPKYTATWVNNHFSNNQLFPEGILDLNPDFSKLSQQVKFIFREDKTIFDPKPDTQLDKGLGLFQADPLQKTKDLLNEAYPDKDYSQPNELLALAINKYSTNAESFALLVMMHISLCHTKECPPTIGAKDWIQRTFAPFNISGLSCSEKTELDAIRGTHFPDSSQFYIGSLPSEEAPSEPDIADEFTPGFGAGAAAGGGH